MDYIFSTTNPMRYRFPTHDNYLVMDRSEAAGSEVFIVEIAPGKAPPRHQHGDMEQVFYILSGRGQLEVGDSRETHAVVPGHVVRIPPATPHTIRCQGDAPLRYLAVDCFPAGRSGSESTWDQHIRHVCQEMGWRFEDVIGEGCCSP